MKSKKNFCKFKKGIEARFLNSVQEPEKPPAELRELCFEKRGVTESQD